MNKDIALTLLALTIGFPVILGIHIGKSFWAGMKKFSELQKELWHLVAEDFK